MEYPWHNPPVWHAINVHLPIVLGVLGLPLVCLLAITRGKHRGLRWGTVAFYAVVALSAWFAAQTGERAMEALSPSIPAAAAERVNFHEWMAEKVWIFAAGTTLLLLFANLPRRAARQTFTTLALVFSVATVGWITVTAHSGGLAVYEHGLGTVAMRDPVSPKPDATALAQADSRPRERAVEAPVTQPATVPVTQAIAPTASALPVVSYARDIQPLLKQRCAECHAGAELKGNFDISTVASILKGGKKAGAGLLAGKPEESAVVQYVEGKKQPRMPKGSKEMPAAEIALIRAWIAAGAVDDSAGSTVVASAVNEKTPALPSEATTAPAEVAPAASTAPSTAPVAEVTPVVVAPSAAAPPPAPAPVVEEVVSPDWDPQTKFPANEAVAVRRWVRMSNLKAPPAPPKSVDQPVYNEVDRFIVAKWPSEDRLVDLSAKPQAAATQPTSRPVCDDGTFARRVFLDVVGAVPTADEARKFVEDKDEKKRDKLIDALLARSKDYAANWVPFWEDALCSNGLHQGGVGTHGNYRQWIFETFRDNKPFDTMVQELLDPSMPDHPPRYVLNDNHERTLQSASNTAQVFLGTAIKCASCHSHFLNDEWPQARATAFSGYFTDKDLELIRCERKSGEFVKTHFMFDLPKAPTSVPADGAARLKRVAQLLTDPTNPRFAKTMVNRLWKRYMGLGLFEPADDYREDTPPSHPELLDWLAHDFITHGYDVKRTTRLILTSRTYQLRYDPSAEDKFDVEKPKEPRYYRSPSLRRLTAEQLLDSIQVALERKLPDLRAYQDDKSSPLTRSLGKPAARNEVSTQRADDTAVVQALELLNGKEFYDRVYKGSLIAASAAEKNIETVVDDLYWSTLGRAPTHAERMTALEFLMTSPRPKPTTQPTELVWVEDDLPSGAKPAGPWKFAAKPEHPVFSGNTSHSEDRQTHDRIQHNFTGVKFPVTPKDTLFTYVYLDPKSPPKEILVQFHTAKTGWDQRAAWGPDEIEFKPKVRLGALPKTGEWVRLEIPAEKIGFKKAELIDGISFDHLAGNVYWDKTGVVKGSPVTDPETIGDMLWALVSSPEFQYVK